MIPVIEALVFDMDGLLLDSERIVQRSWEAGGKELGFSNMGNHIYHTLGMNVAGRNAYFAKVIGDEFPFDEFAQATRKHFQRITDAEGLPVKPGAREILEYGKEEGYKMAVATSSRSGYAVKVLKDAGIYDYFDGFVFGDMITHTKPAPEIYLKACEKIQTEPERCVALEDAPKGIVSAYTAGMLPVMVPDLVEPDSEILKLVHRKCSSLLEVKEWLQTISKGCL